MEHANASSKINLPFRSRKIKCTNNLTQINCIDFLFLNERKVKRFLQMKKIFSAQYNDRLIQLKKAQII